MTQEAVLRQDELDQALEIMRNKFLANKNAKDVVEVIDEFREMEKAVKLAFEEEQVKTMAVQAASLALKFEIPKLKKYDEYEEDEDAEFIAKLIEDYIFYLDDYLRHTNEPSELPTNLITVMVLLVFVVIIAKMKYY